MQKIMAKGYLRVISIRNYKINTIILLKIIQENYISPHLIIYLGLSNNNRNSKLESTGYLKHTCTGFRLIMSDFPPTTKGF